MQYAHNPDTGEVYRLNGDAWEKVPSARGQNGEVFALEGEGWKDISGAARPPEKQSGFMDSLKNQDWRGVAQAAGSALGGVAAGVAGQLGPQVATPEEVFTVPAAMAAGGAMAGNLYDRAAEMFGGEAPASPAEQAYTATKDAAYDVAGGYIGGKVLGGVAKAADPVSARLMDAWRKMGATPPSLGAVSEKPAVHMVESALSKTITGANRMDEAYSAGRKKLQEHLADVGANYLEGQQPPITIEEIGAAALRHAGESKRAFQQWARRQEDAIFGTVGEAPAGLKNAMAWINQETARLSPAAGAHVQANLSAMLKNEMADATTGTLNVDTVRALRTRLGQMLDPQRAATTGDVDDRLIRGLRDALGKDVEEAIGIQAPDVLSAYKDYMKAYSKEKTVRDLAESMLTAGGKPKSLKQIGEMFLSPSLDGSRAAILKQALGPEGWNVVRAGAVRQLGRGTSGSNLPLDEANPATFATLMGHGKGGFTPEAQKVLFGDSLDAAKTAAQGMKDAGRYANTSNTAKDLEVMNLFRTVPGAMQGLLTGTAAAGASPYGAAAALGAPYLGARMHTSPALINMLASPRYKAALESIRTAAPVVGRVGGLLSNPNNQQ